MSEVVVMCVLTKDVWRKSEAVELWGTEVGLPEPTSLKYEILAGLIPKKETLQNSTSCEAHAAPNILVLTLNAKAWLDPEHTCRWPFPGRFPKSQTGMHGEIRDVYPEYISTD